jgi:hypothetical protein
MVAKASQEVNVLIFDNGMCYVIILDNFDELI